jgi:hypothetical protein
MAIEEYYLVSTPSDLGSKLRINLNFCLLQIFENDQSMHCCLHLFEKSRKRVTTRSTFAGTSKNSVAVLSGELNNNARLDIFQNFV